ncbi:2-amino-4-hydroxy-6-hydroxymethyldihydropteridine diphosphokinase [Thalassoroseus pseudoceratinae]|uniref:2-amino-4-hydroxy-6- hydroxymethyldihydropteridine diphosphokinase n=1 Tax=Thalassoroseus pseudoceratinae TaxID=2713176 RepID=UPI001423A370|nr:2-amino-4-hydroxy-6-hydroxymethyldihydropteridine diphosphokinase [Thalassoroseus pseudoceratinae]
MRTNCFIAFGGNLGNVSERFQECWQVMRESDGFELVQTSPIYESRPMGQSAGTNYCNAAVEVRCDLSPQDLLVELQCLETRFGRQRDIRWGPRTLDLDILLYGDEVVQTPTLEIPHPGIVYRRFVLDPLCDIAPSVRHPVYARRLSELRDGLLKRPLLIAVEPTVLENIHDIERTLASRFSKVCIVDPADVEPSLVLSTTDEHLTQMSRSSCNVNLAKMNSDFETALVDVLSAALG